MKRFAQCFLLLSLAGFMPMLNASQLTHFNNLNLAEISAEPLKQQSFLEQKAPWLHNRLVSWQNYLGKKPEMKHVQPKAEEEISAQFSHSWATRAFGATGHKVDPSALVFGRQAFLVKDAFVASKLLASEEARVVPKIDASQPLPNNNRHFLCLLAGQELGFTSTQSRQEMLFSYKRSFMNKKLQVAVNVPFIRCEQSLDLAAKAEISKANRAALVDATSMNSPLVRNALGDMRTPIDAPGFYEKYSDMDNFLTHVLDDAGIVFAKKQEEIGLGDIVLSCMYDKAMAYVDYASIGGELSLNTAKSPRNIALAEPTLGQGVSTVKGFAHFGWHRGLLANPFVKMSLGYSLPTTVGMRVPYALTYNGVSNIGDRMSEAFPRSIPFSDLITLGGAAFESLPETEIAAFASSVQKVTLRKGFSYGFTLGNTFEQCFDKPMYVTVAYDYAGRQEQNISDLERAHQFCKASVTRATGTSSHAVLMNLGYRLSSLCTIEGGVRSCFAGRNALKTTQVFGSLALRF